MNVICAIAYNTFQEAVRSKVFLICLILVGILGFMTPMIPSLEDPISRLQLATSISQSICVLFGLIIIIFTASAAIPEDIDTKRIYTIFPKPVSRASYLIGKTGGLVCLSFVLIFLFGFIIIGFVRSTYLSFNADDRIKAAPFFSIIRKHEPSKVMVDKEIVKNISYPFQSISYEFSKIDGTDIRPKISVTALLFFKDFQNDGLAHLDLKVWNLSTGSAPFVIKDLTLAENVREDIELDKGLFVEGKKCDYRIDIELTQASKSSMSFLIRKENFFFHKPSGSFEFNVLKYSLIISLQFSLLSLIAIMGATRLSYYVSILFSFTIFCAGYFATFLWETIEDTNRLREINALSKLKGIKGAVLNLLENFTDQACRLAPNFGDYSVSTELIHSLSIPASKMIDIFQHYAIYGFAYFLIATVLFWRKEV